MSQIVPTIGPFESVYICLAGSPSSFIQLSAVTTNDNTFDEITPQVFVYATKSDKQAGPITVKLHLEFLSDDPVISRLANGNWENTPWIDTPASFLQYGVLCIHPDYDSESSLYIPYCETQKGLNEVFSKERTTNQVLDFTWFALSRFADPVTGLQPYYKRTVAELATLIGPYFPISL